MRTATRLLVSIFISFVALPLAATSYLVPGDAELVDRADAIVLVKGLGSTVIEREQGLYTEYRVTLLEVLKGDLAAGLPLSITEPGGTVNGVSFDVPGAPVYRNDETSLAFLQRTSGGWRTWGLGLGKFDRVTGENGTTFLMRGLDGHDIVGFNAAGLTHVERVRDETGFLEFVRATVKGERFTRDYLASADIAAGAQQAGKRIAPDAAPGPLAYLLGPVSGRWNTGGGSKNFSYNPNGLGSVTSLIDGAATVWRNDPNSAMDPQRGTSVGLGAQRCPPLCSGGGDGTSLILFNANLSALGAGVVGYTTIRSSGVAGPHTHRGQLLATLGEADVEIGSTLTSDSQRQGVLTHELGHAYGFRHSNCSDGNPCSNSALMRATNIGSALLPWDVLAASTVYSSAAIICPTDVVTSDPQDRTGAPGSQVSLSAGVSNAVLPIAYQWYRGSTGDTSNPVAGGTGQSLIVTVSGTQTYWVRATNGCDNSENSAAATVSPSSCTPPQITVPPQGQSIASGQTATLNVTATGTAPLNYLWYEVGIVASPAPGINNQSSYTTPPLSATTAYYVVVSNGCSSVQSASVTVTVGGGCVGPVITTQPSSTTTNALQSVIFNVAASGTAPLSYQWYRGASGDFSNPFPGATGSSFTTEPLSASIDVWVRVTNACGSANSNTATATVGCLLTAPEFAIPATAESGQIYTATFGPAPGAVAYEIQEATNPDFTNASTRTETGSSTTFVHTAAPPTPVAYYYRARGIVSCFGINTPSAYTGTARTVVDPPATPQPPPVTGIDISVPAGSGAPAQFQYVLEPPAGLASAPFVATTDVAFLSVSPTQGTAPTTLTVTAQTTTLPEGTTSGTVLVTFTTPKRVGPLGSTAASTPVNVSAVTAVAPAPKGSMPPDNTLIIPAVAHADGIGASFVSDIRIANTFTQSLRYRLTYTPSNTNGLQVGQQTTVNVNPGSTTAMNDIVKQWYGVGALSGEGGKGVLEIRPENYSGKIDEDARSAYSTVATSRTYAKTPSGTFGQYIPAIPFSRFVGRTTDQSRPTSLSLQQIAQSPQMRTNLGLVEASGQPATVRIRVFTNEGQQVGDFTESLGPSEFKQFDQYLATKGITLNDGRIQVDVVSDTGRITAYASVLDNATADPLLVEATRVLDTKSRRFVVPGLARTTGNGANWQSDIRVFNPTSAPIAFSMTFYPQANPGGAIVRQRTVNPGQILALDNVLESGFSTTGAGAVHIETANESPLIVTARTYDRQPAGSYGQFIPAVTSADAIGAGQRSLQLLQVEHSDRFRTNVGLVEVSGQPVTVRITAIIPQRSTAPVITRNLAANEFVQLNGMLPNFMNVQGNAYNVRLVMEVVGGSGRLSSYASVIDNATQDPTYIPAQ